MPRLIVVSNRVAIPGAGNQAGGLAVAVNAALRKQPGIWFGWSGKIIPDGETTELKSTKRGKITYLSVDLNETNYKEYYNGFSNSVLWPILHYRMDLAHYSQSDLSGYLRVNALFADKLAAILEPDDLIWVHDYHLMPLARELRARGCKNAIGFFLHIPCPPPDLLTALPQHDLTIGSLTDYNLVGFQTPKDKEHFTKYLEARGAVAGKNDSHFSYDGRAIEIGAFPVGIAASVYVRAARASAKTKFMAEMRESLGGRKLILGVDRLDYSKGITHRLQAFERFLEMNQDLRGTCTFLQITPRSRSDVDSYADMEQMVSALVGQINGAYGEASWTPLRYVNRSYTRTQLAGMYRAANVALITPLRDGMNLVAKEYVAAQDPEDPGVLVLSQFAGAAAELRGALIVNPHELEGVAKAIRMALEMPLGERRLRHADMLAQVQAYDIDHWANDFLKSLRSVAHQSPHHGMKTALLRPGTMSACS